MLIEIFDNHIYWETPCDNEKGIKSERVPIRKIHLENDEPLRTKYNTIADFLNKVLNPNNRFHSMYVVETNKGSMSITSVEINSEFEFGYDILDDTKDTINGKISIDQDNNIISYNRNSENKVIANNKDNYVIIPCGTTKDPRSTGYDPTKATVTYTSQLVGRNDSVIDTTTGGTPANFPDRNTRDEENSSLKELTASCKDSGIPEEVKTVDSDDGINILSNGIVEFESEEVSIAEDSATLEAKKKASQNAFMAAMNAKFKKSINNSKSK